NDRINASALRSEVEQLEDEINQQIESDIAEVTQKIGETENSLTQLVAKKNDELSLGISQVSQRVDNVSSELTQTVSQSNEENARQIAQVRQYVDQKSSEIMTTTDQKLGDQEATIQQIQKVQTDTSNNLNSMWAVKLQQMQDGRLYIAGIGAGIENTPDGMQSQVLLAADRIAMINPANGNTKPMFVGQGDQIFMNDVFLKRLTAPTITSGGNPPVFSLTPDGRLTAKNADISGNVNANSGTLNNVTINENCRVLGKLSANQIEGDLVKTVGKAFPRDSRAPERWPSGTITVRVYDDQPFDRQIVIPAVAFSGAKHERENNDIYSSCRLIVRKNGAEIYNRTALDNTLIYSGVIDMPAGRGHMTLEFSVSS
ncbi:phage tail tip protein, partial [Escherichia coli]